jgi:hypothetical protein
MLRFLHVIRFPVQKGGDKEATAKDMLEGLEKNVRRMLSTKQKEYDRIVYDLKHRKMELEKLKLDYKDVTIDKSALGIPTDNAAPKDRLQVVKTVFTTPFFTKDEVCSDVVAAARGAQVDCVSFRKSPENQRQAGRS